MRQIISTFAIAGFALLASCTTTADRVREAKIAEQEQELQELKTQIATQRAIDSVTELARLNGQEAYPIAGEVNTSKARTTRRSSSTRSSSASANSSGSYAGNSSAAPAPVYTPAPAPEKKGWSAKAKGAVIGGVGGAAAGAIINKRNRAAGAVIGGVLGAGAGTGIGAIIDKKNGR